METPAGAPAFSALWSAGVGPGRALFLNLHEPVKKSRSPVIPSKRSALRDLRILLSLAVNPVPGSFGFTQDDSAAEGIFLEACISCSSHLEHSFVRIAQLELLFYDFVPGETVDIVNLGMHSVMMLHI